jgi:arylsulfatase A-like enzyme
VKPNIVVILLDTARADAFEPYGAPVGASPAVAQLAAKGIAHQNFYSTACWTVPAHGSLFSGKLPRSAGLCHIAGQTPAGFKAALGDIEPELLPAVLGKSGYHSMGVTTNLWVSEHSGFDSGFETFRYLKGGRNAGITPANLRGQVKWVLEALQARTDDGAEAVRDVVTEWMSGRDTRPFFLFVNLLECHSPYLPPKPWNKQSPLRRAQTALEAQKYLTFRALWKGCLGGYDIPEGAIERMRENYAASIRQLDDWIARVVEMFDNLRLLDDTEIIITSDHGENLGEGRLIGHAFSLDNRLIRLPFVASGPIDLPSTPLLSIADLPRLLAKAAGLDDHPWSDGPTGEPPVAQFDAPGTPTDPRVIDALEEWKLGDDARRIFCTPFMCATDGKIKLLRRLGREELVDLATDPLEERPVVIDADLEATYGQRLVPLRAAIDKAEETALPKRPEPGEEPSSPDEVVELEEQMRLLGYL